MSKGGCIPGLYLPAVWLTSEAFIPAYLALTSSSPGLGEGVSKLCILTASLKFEVSETAINLEYVLGICVRAILDLDLRCGWGYICLLRRSSLAHGSGRGVKARSSPTCLLCRATHVHVAGFCPAGFVYAASPTILLVEMSWLLLACLLVGRWTQCLADGREALSTEDGLLLQEEKHVENASSTQYEGIYCPSKATLKVAHTCQKKEFTPPVT